jgi:hypothetical protein
MAVFSAEHKEGTMPVMIKCTWCGKDFTPNRSDGLFHNKACKQQYWRWKHRLNYLYSVAHNAIGEIEQYLEYENKRNEAENVLGSLADTLHNIGFTWELKQMELPQEAYVISNQLGGKDE